MGFEETKNPDVNDPFDNPQAQQFIQRVNYNTQPNHPQMFPPNHQQMYQPNPNMIQPNPNMPPIQNVTQSS